MRSIAFALSASVALAALPALADEVWSSAAGEIIYETALDSGMSILSMPADILSLGTTTGARAYIYVPYFDVEPGTRGYHEAFWIVEGAEYCDMALAGPDGRSSRAWGQAFLMFDKPDFPTPVTVLFGYCTYDPYLPVRAEPVLGD